MRTQTTEPPHHVAFIMDGNSRWAKKNGRGTSFGHSQGVEALKRVIEMASEFGIKAVSFYAFSSENWSRPLAEVSFIMNLAYLYFSKFGEQALLNNVRIRIIGDRSDVRVPKRVKEAIAEIEALTESCSGLQVFFAFNYSGEKDIMQAATGVAQLVSEDSLKSTDVDKNVFRSFLQSHAVPDIDLMVRTGGERRLSNFLPVQLSYAELHFSDLCWPDFGKHELKVAVEEYQSRHRTFGKRVEQLEAAE